jgi:hypothetical protein
MGPKLSVINLPAQSGKTRKMTELINKWKQKTSTHRDNTQGNCLNCIFTSNNKLLAKQTASRIHSEVDNASINTNQSYNSMDDDFSEISDITTISDTISDDLDVDDDTDDNENNNTIVWVSNSKKSTSKPKQNLMKTVSDVFMAVTSDDDDVDINNIICCTNKHRMKCVWELLEKLHKKFLKNNFQKKINIWIDEADDCIKIWNTYLFMLKGMIDTNFIQSIILMTATMKPVYKHLFSNNIEPQLRTYDETYPSVYHTYLESNIIHELSDNTTDYYELIMKILDNNPDMLNPGIRLFCPGNKKKETHEHICQYLKERKFNVLILNGTHKEFRFFDGRHSIDIFDTDDQELSKRLSQIYYKHNLMNYPFAVTGNLCVGRGITFASEMFTFTHGIIPNTNKGPDAYQMVSRCLGNIKLYPTYTIPKIFVSTKTHNLIKYNEYIAIHSAKTHFHQDTDEPMITMTKEILNNITNNPELPTISSNNTRRIKGNVVDINTYRIYKDEYVVKKVCKELNYDYRTTKNNSQGFKETSLNRKKEVASLTDAISKVPTAYGTNKGVKTWRTYYPCYVDITNKDTLRFVVIIRPDTDGQKLNEVDTTYPSIQYN